MPNTVTLRVVTDGAKESAGDLDAVKQSAVDLGTTAKQSLGDVQDAAADTGASLKDAGTDAQTAGDDFKAAADKSSGLKDKLHGIGDAIGHLDKSSLRGFAGAIDTLAGTDLKPLAGQLADIGNFAGDLSSGFEDEITTGLDKLKASGPITAAATGLGAVIGTAQAEAQAAVATGQQAVASIGAKIAAMSIPLAAEGTTVGTAVGSAMGAAVTVGWLAALGAGVGGTLFGPGIITEHLLGADTTSKVAGIGAQIAHSYASGFGETAQQEIALLAQQAVDESLANGASLRDAAQAGVDVANAYVSSLSRTVTDQLATHIASERAENDAAYAAMGQSAGLAFTGDLASALQNNTNVIDTAMDKVKWAIEHPMELLKQEAELNGALTDIAYQRGLAGNTDEQNTIFDQQTAALEAQWLLLTGKAWTAGGNAGSAYLQAYRRAALGGKNLPDVSNIHPGSNDERGPKPRAKGGHQNAHELGLVGEEGPELWKPDVGGTVIPLKAGGMSGFGGEVHVHVHLEGDAAQMFRVMDRQQGRALSLSQSSTYSRG